MREIPVPRRVEAWRYAKPISLSFLLLGLGIWLGSAFFPVVEIQVVERRVEVPVERLVEKRVPYEVIKYVDRVFEKRVEVPVERIVLRRIKAPVDKVISSVPDVVSPQGDLVSNHSHWRKIVFGMTVESVVDILGEPKKVIEFGTLEIWCFGINGRYKGSETVCFLDGRVQSWEPPLR
jgi:hypothetical protein